MARDHTHLRNLELVYLPPNTVSRLQPLDADIIAAIKCRYRRRKMRRALHLMDSNSNNIYKVDQHRAMDWMREIWETRTESIIYNSWRMTSLVKEPPKRVISIESLVMAEREALAYMLYAAGPQTKFMCIENFVSPQHEDEVCDVTSA